MFGETMRFPVSHGQTGCPAPQLSAAPDLQSGGQDHPELRFADGEGVVLFDRSAEHHLYMPFLDLLLRQYQTRPESRATVRDWVAARNSDSPLGFDALCNYLDLDADYVREGLTRWMNKVDLGRATSGVAAFSRAVNHST